MKELNKKIKAQFALMCATGQLFVSEITGRQVWQVYIESFEDDPIFRDPDSSSHNCNLCNNFLRRYGNIVAIDSEGNLMSIFDIDASDTDYEPSVKALQQLLRNSKIQDVFFEDYDTLNTKLNYESIKKTQDSFKLGIEENFKKYTAEEAKVFGVVEAGEIKKFNHFCVDLPKVFVNASSKSTDSLIAFYRDKQSVFKRAMEEIPLDTLELVKDLIKQGSLLDGTAHLNAIEAILPFANAANDGVVNQETWYWKVSYQLEERIAKFKNTLIGVLCTELAEGMELNKACENWNKRVDPVNYHKASAPITQRQIAEAQKFVEENGYTESFNRRLAVLEDITAEEIYHINAGDGEIPKISVFDKVKPTSTRHKRSEFDKLQEVSIDKFMKDVLPSSTSIEAYLENNHQGNMVVLTTAEDKTSKPIFKWSNNFSWTFNGNLAGKSQIKENVKTAGGKITGLLRCSLQWNDEDTKGRVDFDLHCTQPNKQDIYFGNKGYKQTSGGMLDVDMIRPSKIGIENITWQQKLPDGDYIFRVDNYDFGSNNGFKVEIEFNGNIYNYFVQQKNVQGMIKVATITSRAGQLSITHHLPESHTSKDIWGLETNQFHKVNLVCLSPNHWGENKSGNLHYMFMLDKCAADIPIRGFHNENLLPELLKHRKVMEVLGNTSLIEPTSKHLAGLGFNSTVKDELVVKVKGSHNRMLKIKF